MSELTVFSPLGQFVSDIITILHDAEVFEELEAGRDPSNKWKIAYDLIYDRENGPARGFEKPSGDSCISNFKTKVTKDLWPSIAQKCRERPDDEIGPDYEDMAVVDFCAFEEARKVHHDAVADKNKKKKENKEQMEQVEEQLAANPPGIGADGASKKHKRGNLAPTVNPLVAGTLPAAATGMSASVGDPSHVRPSDLQYNAYGVIDSAANNVLNVVTGSVKKDLTGLMEEYGLGAEDKNTRKKRQKVKDLRDAEAHAISVGDDPQRIAKLKRRREKLEDELIWDDGE